MSSLACPTPSRQALLDLRICIFHSTWWTFAGMDALCSKRNLRTCTNVQLARHTDGREVNRTRVAMMTRRVVVNGGKRSAASIIGILRICSKQFTPFPTLPGSCDRTPHDKNLPMKESWKTFLVSNTSIAHTYRVPQLQGRYEKGCRCLEDVFKILLTSSACSTTYYHT